MITPAICRIRPSVLCGANLSIAEHRTEANDGSDNEKNDEPPNHGQHAPHDYLRVDSLSPSHVQKMRSTVEVSRSASETAICLILRIRSTDIRQSAVANRIPPPHFQKIPACIRVR